MESRRYEGIEKMLLSPDYDDVDKDVKQQYKQISGYIKDYGSGANI